MFIARSVLFGKAWPMRCTWPALVLTLIVWTPAFGAARPHDRVCLTAAQAREMIGLHRLAEPFRLMKAAAHRFQAEALRVKLCRRKDQFVYEISLLRHDGRVIHVILNALNGKLVHVVNAK